ncbi:hypothetical protein [Microseira wollei]|uniref:Uncharacterized protein n=1 Tax=Microseira wollei NIES-4236 TaxID=2530354 RepID=A0AAV3X141_9CYAN|nr:hypothetical protein [Microseira wollei]GET35873.1 hypothetical protein MiSe_06210 [Microseira wollei NIES-4236]
MVTVYLKGGKTVEVSLENLKDYLDKNRSRIETRRVKLGRPRIKKVATTTDISSK